MINLKDSDAPLPELKISLPDHFADSAEKIYAAITKINETHNLTRITSEEDFKIRHLIDSISSVGYYPELGTDEIKINTSQTFNAVFEFIQRATCSNTFRQFQP